uniref:Uncharacterized protein n=1 Tax=Ignisphaera aggregans TaxID=334771 RepID=A0A7C5YTM3_9CREN
MLLIKEHIPLLDMLVELNLVIDNIEGREEWYWIDEPPPEKDRELGIGRYIAWQTPLHREAVKTTLKKSRNKNIEASTLSCTSIY